MSRYFMINSWVGSHENEPDYDGNMCGSRAVRSTEVVPLYDIYGKANTAAFSDEAIAARMGKKPTGISLTDRILPQKRRLNTLNEQLRELESEYRAGKMSIQDYTVYRDVLSVKRDRAEFLYRKAVSVKPVRDNDDYPEESLYTSNETPHYGRDSAYTNDVRAQDESDIGDDTKVSWIDELSPSNSLKKPLKIACTLIKTAVHWSHKARSYWNELKAV